MERIKISRKEYEELLSEVFSKMEVDGMLLNENWGRTLVGAIKSLVALVPTALLMLMNAFRKWMGNKSYGELTKEFKNLNQMNPQQWNSIAQEMKKTIMKGDRSWWVINNPNSAGPNTDKIQTYAYTRTPMILGIHNRIANNTKINDMYNPFEVSQDKGAVFKPGVKTIGLGNDDYIIQMGFINVKGKGAKMYWSDPKNAGFINKVLNPLIRNLEEYKKTVATNYLGMVRKFKSENPETFKKEDRQWAKIANWVAMARGGRTGLTTAESEKAIQPAYNQTITDITNFQAVLKEAARSASVRWKLIASGQEDVSSEKVANVAEEPADIKQLKATIQTLKDEIDKMAKAGADQQDAAYTSKVAELAKANEQLAEKTKQHSATQTQQQTTPQTTTAP